MRSLWQSEASLTQPEPQHDHLRKLPMWTGASAHMSKDSQPRSLLVPPINYNPLRNVLIPEKKYVHQSHDHGEPQSGPSSSPWSPLPSLLCEKTHRGLWWCLLRKQQRCSHLLCVSPWFHIEKLDYFTPENAAKALGEVFGPRRALFVDPAPVNMAYPLTLNCPDPRNQMLLTLLQSHTPRNLWVTCLTSFLILTLCLFTHTCLHVILPCAFDLWSLYSWPVTWNPLHFQHSCNVYELPLQADLSDTKKSRITKISPWP